MEETYIDDVNFNQNTAKNKYGSICSETKTLVWPSTMDSGQHKAKETLSISEEMDIKLLKRRIWMNVGLLMVAVFFLFMGVVPVAFLQSSLNSKSGLGVASMAVKNGFMMVGSIVAPSIMQRFGCKTAIVIGAAFYITYVPANFYPSWFTLVPMAILSGLGCTLQTVAHKVYLARLAHLYAGLVNMEVDRVNSRLFVLLVCAMKLSSALGNFMASFILDTGTARVDSINATHYDDLAQLQMCGVNYCNEVLETSLVEDNEDGFNWRMYLLISFCTVSSLLAVLSFSFLDSLKKLGIGTVMVKLDSSPVTVLKDLFVAMRDPRHVLFIPMAMALSGGDAFWTADYAKAFITCSIGMSMLGYVSLWNGLSGTVSCILLGWFNNKHMRSVPVVCATLLQMIVITALFYWNPSPSFVVNYWALSIFGIIFFFGSGIRHFIAPVLISVVFKDNLETAYSVYHFWIYISSTVVYAWSSALCITFKLYFLLVVLFLSFIGYIAMELIVHSKHSSPQRIQYQKLIGDSSH